MEDKKYYLKVQRGIYSSSDFENIINKLKDIVFDFTLDKNDAERTYNFVKNWKKEGTIAGIEANYISEKFLHWSISTSLEIKDLDKE